MRWWHPADIGFALRSKAAAIGQATRLLLRLVAGLGYVLKRPGLLRDQIHFLGNYSLAIIGVSGLFVGFVLGCRATTSCSATARPRPWA